MVLLTTLVLTIVAFLCGEKLQKFIIDNQSWYERRLQEANEFEFPNSFRMHKAENETLEEYGAFDFIVVGAGSTGCVVANRLSENASWSILLVEAGSFRDEDLTTIPAWDSLNAFSKFNWGYWTTPQTNAYLGSDESRAFIPTGKGIGGSSLINNKLYSRGNKRDYDKWSELLDDSSWNYENVLPYFQKSEEFLRTNPYVPTDYDYHGYGGSVPITQNSPPIDLSNIILEGGQEFGYNLTDYNGREQKGFSVKQFFFKNGRRFDHDEAFISPVLERRNLEILDESFVTRIEFFRNSNQVKGVIFTRNNKTFIATCRKEVILSAGAINSPQILMLSGIGPRDHLKSLGIDVLRNLPVGNNLHDHTITFLVLSSNITSESPSTVEAFQDLQRGKGVLTREEFCDVIGFLSTSLVQTVDQPDIEFLFNNLTNSDLSRKAFGFSKETFNALQPRDLQGVFTLVLFKLNQKSVGTVRLNSSDPFEYPLIDLNALSDEDNSDIETLYQGIQTVLKLIETDAFRRLNISLAITSFPGCNDLEPLSREFWYCYIRRVTGTGYRQAGTCSTGKTRRAGVVDGELKVYSIKGLRVADASVIPVSLGAHLNAPCTMIGEKVSDIIKQTYT